MNQGIGMMGQKYYATSFQYIMAELKRIDLLIRLQVLRVRNIRHGDSEFPGLFISEREVESLLKQPVGQTAWADVAMSQTMADIQSAFDQLADEILRRKTESVRQGIFLRLDQLATLFRLTPFDIDILLICLAPEIDLRYERLYAYLQDDVTKKRPSVDLILNLLCPSFDEKLISRQRFSSSAPLFRDHLLNLFVDPSNQNPPLLSKYLKLDERVVNYLLDSDELDSRLLNYARHIVPQARLDDMFLPADIKSRLRLLSRRKEAENEGVVLYFQGSYGVGKQTTAEALCRELKMGLFVIDGERLLNAEELNFATAVRLAKREALLQRSVLYWDNFDSLLADDRRSLLDVFIRELEERPELIFLAGNETWEPMNAMYDLPFVRIEFRRLACTERVQLWQRSLDSTIPLKDEVNLNTIANTFRFTGGQIRDAAATARNLASWRDPENEIVSMADLHAACRLQSNRKLTALAQKITPRFRWDDIILPLDRLHQLREICNHVKYRSLVYENWGFERKLSVGKGLNVLFAGPSGTGKTMASEVLSGELGLDLYKIDLSRVVSKYIGETEKNLARIFTEAEHSNAILFFDEADALFGKRSEVKDAHDRYANIEVGYLLQKMEEYEGITILATNLRQNMDAAFVRRMQFIVEFPFPDESHRYKIWQVHFPDEAPRDDVIDFDFLARQLKLTGGSIRNIVVNASFLAASNGGKIGMECLIHAAKGELQKMGKLCVKSDFGKYFELLESGIKDE